MARVSRRSIRLALLAIEGRCWFCSKELDVATATLDHFVPLSRGGTDAIQNLRLSCVRCNRRKGNGNGEGLATGLRPGYGMNRIMPKRK